MFNKLSISARVGRTTEPLSSSGVWRLTSISLLAIMKRISSRFLITDGRKYSEGMHALICSYLVFEIYRWRIFPKRKLCKYFGDRALVSREIIQGIKELLCKRLAAGELKWSSFMETCNQILLVSKFMLLHMLCSLWFGLNVACPPLLKRVKCLR